MNMWEAILSYRICVYAFHRVNLHKFIIKCEKSKRNFTQYTYSQKDQQCNGVIELIKAPISY